MALFLKNRGLSMITTFMKTPALKVCPVLCPTYRHSCSLRPPGSGGSTIFALSTPPGVSAIAVVRVSGCGASDVLHKMGKFKQLPTARKAVLRNIWHPDTEELLDRALVLWFPGPSSFTGEDMCELHVHGGKAVIKSVLNGLSKLHNFRYAEPGEFTKRAFLANKLDLTKIEGLANLLLAETEAQQKQALRQMDGALHRLYAQWSDQIKRCLARMEAYIDFNEDQLLDDSIPIQVSQNLRELEQEMRSHLTNCVKGERLRSGVRTALIGRPNVGKSSLLNLLCQRDMAIVSPTAGTTRDVIEASINLSGYLVCISDTAGIRETQNLIEIEGVKRAKEKARQADILILVTDAQTALQECESKGLPNETVLETFISTELGEHFKEDILSSETRTQCDLWKSNFLLLLNKVDLLDKEKRERIMRIENECPHICPISCTEGTGMDHFLSKFSEVVTKMCSENAGEDSVLIQERHKTHISICLQHINQYNAQAHRDAAIAAEQLRLAMNELGKITGKVFVDDILDVIFQDFCIGK